MKLKKKAIFKMMLMIGLSAFILSSCTKKDDIGKELVELPGDALGVGFVDTVTVISYSNFVDSFPSDEINTNMLGSYYDPEMGVTTTGFYTQIRMVTNDIDFGSKAVFDSVVLTLDYAYIYGKDSLFEQTIRVYELDQDIFQDSTYYSNSDFQVYSPEIGNVKTIFNNRDSIYEGKNKLHAHLRLKLDDSFGHKIFDKSGQPELSNNEEFVKYIKGLYVVADKVNSPGGDIAGINLLSSYSRLAIFYHDDKDTLTANFVINENTARVQVYNHHDYQDASASFIQQVVNGDTTLGEQVVYMQPMAGVKTAIRFPYLKELIKDHLIALNKAELILQVDPSFMDFEGPPPKIVLVKQTAEGKYLYLKDKITGEPDIYLGGRYDKDKKQYYYTITRHLQSILSGEEVDYGMYLLIEGSGIIPNRVILLGSKVSNRLRLRLFFTDLN